MNKTMLIGNLGQDPKQIRHDICHLSVATADSWIDKTTGEKKSLTEWHRVVVFGKKAGLACQYLRKGSKIYVEGKLQTRKWQDQHGHDKFTTEIVVSDFGSAIEFLDPKPQQQQQPQYQQHPMQQPQPQQQQQISPVITDELAADMQFNYKDLF